MLRYLSLFISFVYKIHTFYTRLQLKSIGKSTTIVPPIRIHGGKFVRIGSGVFIGRNSWLNAIEAYKEIDVVLDIGDATSISGECCISAAKSVVIEDNVLIGRFVHVSDHSHEYRSIESPVKDQGITNPKSVRIKRGAWLGQGVVVCPGVTIGKNAVVGANAVVIKDVPDYCVAVGVPARVVKMLNK